GSISGTVSLTGGGYLSNTATGRITAVGNAVYASGGAASIVNAGTITGGAGIYIQSSAKIINSSGGRIIGLSGRALYLGAGGAVVNHGIIEADGVAWGTIRFGSGAGTVSNFGTIEGTALATN